MRTSIAIVSISGELPEKLEAIAKAGFDAEGFFFEIVQRDGYCGYGTANAIFRIAALKKQIRPEGMPVA
ncbi:hypothetical protein [Sinorhizobium meliloti]|uniref:hypothetical protein n=1 Tax=Rhizobium meliloti TaxID=382 RepID=UPI00041C36AC|nr:hypothetical protein [Sinorhizobium meliloti]